MTIKKYVAGYGIAILAIIVILRVSFFIENDLFCFYYYNNVDNAYTEEIGSPRQTTDSELTVTDYYVNANGTVANVNYKNNTKGKKSSYKMYRSSLERMKKLVKKLKPMLENDQKEYENNKEMQYDVRLIKIGLKEYRIVGEESSKIISEIFKCIRET